MATHTHYPQTTSAETPPPAPTRRSTSRIEGHSPELETDAGGASLKLLVRALDRRPELAKYILREANAVLNAPVSPICELQPAIMRLGVDRVRQIALHGAWLPA